MVQLRSDGLSWQEIDGELVILDLQNSVYLTTNDSGAFLAKLLVEECSLEDLVAALVGEYGIDVELATRDATDFVATLREKRLVVRP